MAPSGNKTDPSGTRGKLPWTIDASADSSWLDNKSVRPHAIPSVKQTPAKKSGDATLIAVLIDVAFPVGTWSKTDHVPLLSLLNTPAGAEENCRSKKRVSSTIERNRYCRERYR